MHVTEVRVKLVENRSERLKAFCTMTLDDEFVVRDIKIIEGTRGLFVAMPSRKVTDHCPRCNIKNSLQAKFCNECGRQLEGGRFQEAEALGDKMHCDIAHPINKKCRAHIETTLLSSYEEELARRDGRAPTSTDRPEDDSDVEDGHTDHKFGTSLA